MLTVRCPVHFPQLVFEKEICFPTNSSKIPLYRLDWSKFDAHSKQTLEKWNNLYKPDVQVPFFSIVPEKIEGLLNDRTFLLEGKYLSEINRCFRQAFEEWQIKKPFDSVIVGTTMEIQKAYVFVGFKLLCDCLFNEKSFYFEKSVLKKIAPHAMAARFWQQYVGTGLIEEFAYIDKLENLLSTKDLGTDSIVVESFIKDLRSNIKGLELWREVPIEAKSTKPANIKEKLENIRVGFLINGDISDRCCEKDTDGDGDCPIHKKIKNQR